MRNLLVLDLDPPWLDLFRLSRFFVALDGVLRERRHDLLLHQILEDRLCAAALRRLDLVAGDELWRFTIDSRLLWLRRCSQLLMRRHSIVMHHLCLDNVCSSIPMMWPL